MFEELERELEICKLDAETKSNFEELSSFIDWFSPNEKMNEHFQVKLMGLFYKMAEAADHAGTGDGLYIDGEKVLC